MLSFDGVELEIGTPVVILQTPIRKSHRLLAGVVVGFGTTQVKVKTALEEWDGTKVVYSRYPNQIMAAGELV